MKKITIGRDGRNDYVIARPAVSGFHADLFLNDDGTMYFADHSTNGTYVNGEYVLNASRILYGGEVLIFPDGNQVPVSVLLSSVMGNAGRSRTQAAENHASAAHPGSVVYDTLPGMKFGDTLKYFFNHYTDFRGRARRQEYWYMVLWNMIFAIVPVVNILWVLATFIPNLALMVRRWHDIGKSAWWMFLYLVPPVAYVVFFVWSLIDSEQDNAYGPSPKYHVRM